MNGLLVLALLSSIPLYAEPLIDHAARSANRPQAPAEKKLAALLGGNDAAARIAVFRDGLVTALKEHEAAPGALNREVAKLIDALLDGPHSGEERRAIVDSLKTMFPSRPAQGAIAEFVTQAEAIDLFRDPVVSDELPAGASRMPGGFRPIIFKNGTNGTIRIRSWRNRGGKNDEGWTENRFPDLQGKAPGILTAREIPFGGFTVELKPGEQIGWEVRRGNRDVAGAVVDKDGKPLAGFTGTFGRIAGTGHDGMIFEKKP